MVWPAAQQRATQHGGYLLFAGASVPPDDGGGGWRFGGVFQEDRGVGKIEKGGATQPTARIGVVPSEEERKSSAASGLKPQALRARESLHCEFDREERLGD